MSLYLQLPQGLFSCSLKYTGWGRATPLGRIEHAFQFLDPSSLLMLPMKILRRLELVVCLGKPYNGLFSDKAYGFLN